MQASPSQIPWLAPGASFSPTTQAWGRDDPAPGLLAAGGSLDVDTLVDAYRQAIFPWYSEGQPILWWSTDPRMVLKPAAFRLHRSLKKALKRFAGTEGCQLRVDTAFRQVMEHCASRPGDTRTGKAAGTWIVPAMMTAYERLHRAGYAHSVETWIDGQLVGGLYCVAIGKAVFGESMFSLQTDASKIALAGLVSLGAAQGVTMIDCQQNTRHLASLGGQEISRSAFAEHVADASKQPPLQWVFENLYWHRLLQPEALPTFRV